MRLPFSQNSTNTVEESISKSPLRTSFHFPIMTLTLDLPMFAPGQTLQYYVDSKTGEPTLTTLKIDKKGRAKVTIQPNGGLIIQ